MLRAVRELQKALGPTAYMKYGPVGMKGGRMTSEDEQFLRGESGEARPEDYLNDGGERARMALERTFGRPRQKVSQKVSHKKTTVSPFGPVGQQIERRIPNPWS